MQSEIFVANGQLSLNFARLAAHGLENWQWGITTNVPEIEILYSGAWNFLVYGHSLCIFKIIVLADFERAGNLELHTESLEIVLFL